MLLNCWAWQVSAECSASDGDSLRDHAQLMETTHTQILPIRTVLSLECTLDAKGITETASAAMSVSAQSLQQTLTMQDMHTWPWSA